MAPHFYKARRHLLLRPIVGVIEYCFGISVAADDDLIDGHHIGGVDFAVAVNIGLGLGEAGCLALNDVAVDGHYIGGVDISLTGYVTLLPCGAGCALYQWRVDRCCPLPHPSVHPSSSRRRIGSLAG